MKRSTEAIFALLFLSLFAFVTFSLIPNANLRQTLSMLKEIFQAIPLRFYIGSIGFPFIILGYGVFARWKREQRRKALEKTAEKPISRISPSNKYAPGREADWYQWRDAYYGVIVPFTQLGKSQDEIIDELKKRDLPFSKYIDIRLAGDNQELVKFKKRPKKK